jgi:uncharacterized protein YPO0396
LRKPPPSCSNYIDILFTHFYLLHFIYQATVVALEQEIVKLKAQAAEAASGAETRMAELQANIAELEDRIASLTTAHKEEIAAVKAASNELLASSSNDLVKKTVEELTTEKIRVVAEVMRDSEISWLHEI